MADICVSAEEVRAISTQLRSGMIHADILAKQLDELVAHARPAVDRDVAEQLYRALRTNGAHTCGVHRVHSCAMCGGDGVGGEVIQRGDEVSKPIKAWAVFDGRSMWGDFFRIRASAQIYAGQRGMGSDKFKELCEQGENPYTEFSPAYSRGAKKAASRIWREFARTHKGARVVRVTVKP